MHMPRPLFELTRFVFALQYKVIKAFNSDMNDKRGLQSVSIALFCFLKDFAEAPNNNNYAGADLHDDTIRQLCSNKNAC